MLCTINDETFHLFTKNTWIGDSGASCYIINDITGVYDVTDINKSVQGCSGNVSSMKKVNYEYKYVKLNAVKSYIYYGPWYIVLRPVQTFIPWHANCKQDFDLQQK